MTADAIPILASTTSVDDCAWWRSRWNDSRARRALHEEQEALRYHTYDVLNFIHVPKCAGHTVEVALCRAFFTNSSSRCTTHTGDGMRYQGGHHTFNERLHSRPMHHHKELSWNHDFATILREPLSRLVSLYNDIHSFLSIPDACNDENGRFRAEPSYCGQHYRYACRAGTGFNTWARIHGHHNGSAPCVPSVSFSSWVRPCSSREASAHLCEPSNRQFNYVYNSDAAANLSAPPDAVEAQFSAMFRRDYLVVGTVSRHDTVRPRPLLPDGRSSDRAEGEWPVSPSARVWTRRCDASLSASCGLCAHHARRPCYHSRQRRAQRSCPLLPRRRLPHTSRRRMAIGLSGLMSCRARTWSACGSRWQRGNTSTPPSTAPLCESKPSRSGALRKASQTPSEQWARQLPRLLLVLL